jgi:hypothetical protein
VYSARILEEASMRFMNAAEIHSLFKSETTKATLANRSTDICLENRALIALTKTGINPTTDIINKKSSVVVL